MNRGRTGVVLLALGSFVGTLDCARRPERAPSSSAPPDEPAPLVAYGAVIRSPSATSPDLRDAIADAAATLRKVTGAEFRVETKGASVGIVLVRADADPVGGSRDRDRLHGRGPEAFVIRSSDATTLTIAASSDAGLINGLYHYLTLLGCRWFFPGENWTVLPRRRDVTVKVDEVVTPAFKMRVFAGTGGFGGTTPIDADHRIQTRWELWKRRNGFGGEFALGGHTYEAFNAAHRQVLEAHPEYLAQVGGKRQPWSVTTKLCVSNPELVSLYVEDRLTLFRRQVKAAPDGPQSFAISVDPSDGGGFCECDKCRAIGSGSPSDQAFYLANQVAKAVAKEMPGRRVSLYAYLEHAAVPTIPLEPNVYVSVIPEAFQRTGLSAEEFIEAWRKKIGGPLSLYTYWSIPDWTNDLPTFDFTTTPREKIRYWHSHGIEGVNFETTYSAGAIGIGLYLASRLLWDTATDDAALLREFYSLAFGPAEAPMRRMLERWAKDFTLSDFEIGLSLRDLAEAKRAAAGNPDVLRRVADYEAYVDYIRRWLEYQEALKTPERIARARDVMADAYRIYDSAMVDSNRMQQLVAERYEKGSGLRAEFSPSDPKASGWSIIGTSDPPGPEASVRYAAVDLPRKEFSSRLVPLAAKAPEAAAAPSQLLFGGPTDFEIDVPSGVSSLDFAIKVQRTAGASGDAVVVRDPSGTAVVRKMLPADGEFHHISVPVHASGRYVVHVEDQKTTFFFTPPSKIPTVFRSFASPWPSPPIYFWVPKGLRKIGIFANGSVPIEVHDAHGRLVSKRRSRVLVLDVPPGEDGAVWSFRDYKGWEPVRMLNLPQVFALSPDALMAPAGVSE